ncbi:hypothetical protein LSTR_LSTR016943 [Laodelphax striatellus]|uniref:DUF7869 domain-containing protein n=1 Tax=Laodelphax striatellus TaxID=195883 RepID=A0A482XBF3_LAOST|nr:hypothetical protein LSTR_LSTR016943 [Laodelphax striatellus]
MLQIAKEATTSANYVMYNRIFNTEYNISFHLPKKDQCEDCITYSNASEEEKLTLVEYHESHLKEKDLSRDEKERDKLTVNSNKIVAVYDLQAVLQCPRGDASSFYYCSKVNVFNFTVFELKTNRVKCFVWNESEGNRGACEIGTCVLKYIESLEDEINNTESKKLDLVFYSDNCCGQQKNKFVLSMYLYAVKKFPFLNSITHKFLVKGHSQNEGDSAHALIERVIKRSLKSGPIFIPSQYVTLIRVAKKTGSPYHVTSENES